MTAPLRPDPDALLASLHREEARAARGQLKVFFGMCPGVGKTFAMLRAAQKEMRDKVDIVVGVVETHGRGETEALLAGLTVITRKQIDHRGIALTEGGLVALLLLFGVVNAINHGGGKVRTILIGMSRPGFGLIKIDRADLEGKPLIAAEAAKDEDDPLRPFARSYFRFVHVLAALDADGDFVAQVFKTKLPAWRALASSGTMRPELSSSTLACATMYLSSSQAER